jgi:N-acetylmuramoyl-L-alanine amidase
MLSLDDQLLQMADPSYSEGGALHVPLQLVVDLIPIFGPAGYMTDRGQFGGGTGSGDSDVDVAPTPDVLSAADVAIVAGAPDSASVDAGDGGMGDVDVGPDSTPSVALVASSAPPPPSAYDLIRGGDRLVVIDAGHGGADVGVVGPGGVTEKSIALSVAIALARELASRPGLDVRVIRDRDIEVAPEYRGDWANGWRGDRPAVFVSIHANSLPERAGVRGFETYSPGCATTAQEIRVAELEAGMFMRDDDPTDSIFVGCAAGPPTEVMRLSADLAGRVQQELGAFHPGPDRGVLNGSFPALTAARMPAVLIEVGFITNPEEERVLARAEFHRQAAAAIARAIDGYFESNPPGGLP